MPRTRLTLQPLGERITPVVWNTPWADAGNITLSFAPDGTDIGGEPSGLDDELAGPDEVWQGEILRAFQAWESQAGISIGLVADDGGAFGSAGPLQGDIRRGDIRIGARPLGDTELAITTPFDLHGGWGGEIILNTDKAFNLGGAGGAYDLFTVMLQEAGHAFGLPNSESPSSAMYTTYQGVRDEPSAGDIADIRGLYGVRSADSLERATGNFTTTTATKLLFLKKLKDVAGKDGTNAAARYVAAGDLTTPTDVDMYRVQTKKGAGFTVSLRTSGLSLLTAKVTVLDAAGTVVGTATASDPTNGDLTVQLNQAKKGGTYYVRVEKAGDAFAVGRYRLAVGAGSAAEEAVHDPVVAGLIKRDGRANDRITSATDLGTQVGGAGPRWDFSARAAISDAADMDYYSFKTGAVPGALVVAAWATRAGELDPVVTVYDAARKPVAVDVLTNDDGANVVQVRNPKANSRYYVKVAADPAGHSPTGAYVLGADLRAAAVQPQVLSATTLTAAAPQASADITVHQAQLFHFSLCTATADARVRSAVRLVVLDENGHEAYTLFAEAGQHVSGDVVLAPGDYTLVFTAGTWNPNDTLPDLLYCLNGLVRSDPIGLTASGTAGTPTGSTPPPTTTTTKPYTGPYSGPYRAL